MITDITLHGALASATGRANWKIAVKSVAEALRAIEAQTTKLYKHLYNTKGVEYRVLINGKDHRGIDDLKIETENLESIEIIPVPSGAGNGLWETIVGVVLIIVAVVMIFVDYSGFTSQALASWGWLLLAGTSMALGGISQMLAKSPSLATSPRVGRNFSKPRVEDEKKKDNNPNYIYSGALNTTSQGTVIPVGYGRLIVGSQVVSFGITRARINYSMGEFTPPDSDPFFDLPFWDTLASDPRAEYVQSYRQIDRYSRTATWEAADALELRTGSNATATVTKLKQVLKWCSRLFVHHEDLTITQARKLYTWLGLTSLDAIQPRYRRFADYVGALSFFYVDETP